LQDVKIFLYAYIITPDKYKCKGNDKRMAKQSFDLIGNITNSVTSSLAGKPQGIINNLAGGDRAGAITILLGGSVDPTPPDWRVRLSVAPNATYLYKDPTNLLMNQLDTTNGCVWPYTPNITMSYSAEYAKNSPTHSNYPIHTYKNSEVSTIGITGDFTAQTPTEAKYLLACMMFLRASTKMFWGSDAEAGQPPPVLYLNGYGSHFLPNVPVVVTNYTANLPDDTDYIEAFIEDSRTQDTENKIETNKLGKLMSRIPATVTMSVSLEPVYSRLKIANEFSFHSFARGDLISRNGSGGFI
jgi:hypothetical protein